jgi:hypothetical protein
MMARIESSVAARACSAVSEPGAGAATGADAPLPLAAGAAGSATPMTLVFSRPQLGVSAPAPSADISRSTPCQLASTLAGSARYWSSNSAK